MRQQLQLHPQPHQRFEWLCLQAAVLGEQRSQVFLPGLQRAAYLAEPIVVKVPLAPGQRSFQVRQARVQRPELEWLVTCG